MDGTPVAKDPYWEEEAASMDQCRVPILQYVLLYDKLICRNGYLADRHCCLDDPGSWRSIVLSGADTFLCEPQNVSMDVGEGGASMHGPSYFIKTVRRRALYRYNHQECCSQSLSQKLRLGEL